jgi:hypothetical protein
VLGLLRQELEVGGLDGTEALRVEAEIRVGGQRCLGDDHDLFLLRIVAILF